MTQWIWTPDTIDTPKGSVVSGEFMCHLLGPNRAAVLDLQL